MGAANDQDGLFEVSPSSSLQLLIYGLVAIALMVADFRYDHLRSIRSALTTAVAPVYYLVDSPLRAVANARAYMSDRDALVSRLAATELELARARELNLRAEVIARENQRLGDLMALPAQRFDTTLAARILEIRFDAYQQRVVINQGSTAGVTVGDAVLDQGGVIGQIETVQRHTAHAIFITDAGHGLPVRNDRTGRIAVALGTGDLDALSIPDLPPTSDLATDDLWVTSGLGGRFPADLPVARTRTIERGQPGGLVAVTARPLADVARARTLLIVKATPKALESLSGR